MKKPNGYVALSMAVLIGTVITGAIIYLANQGGQKSKQLVGDIQTDQAEGELKHYVTQAAALFREELYKGIDPANPSLQNDDFNSSPIDFKCQASPDYKNSKHHFLEPNPPAGKPIVYTCQELPAPEKGALITAFYINKGKVDDKEKASIYVSYKLPIGRALHSKLHNITRNNKLVQSLSGLPVNPGDNDLSIVYLHDLVSTNSTQFVKFLLNDKTVIQLGPSSEFYFKKYHYKKVNERSTLYRFLKGALQVRYGEKNPNEDLTIETPSVSLGVRGTEYNLVVRENAYQYHVTLDVITGQVDVFDKNKVLIKTVKEKETFNHYQSKTASSGINIDGDIRTKEKELYISMPVPTPDPAGLTQTPPIVNWPVNPTEIDRANDNLTNTDDLIKIRRTNLLLYGYFHNANRNKDYFKEIKHTTDPAPGWGGIYKVMRPSLIDEALFLPQNADYDGMELSPTGTTIKPKNFDIALMTPNDFKMTLDPNLDFALVYEKGGSIDKNTSFLLIYPTENLDSLATRMSLGRYSNFNGDYIISPLSGLKLEHGDITGCSGTPCTTGCVPNSCDLAGIRNKLPDPSAYEVSRLVQISNSGKKTVIAWPPVPAPDPTPEPTPNNTNTRGNSPRPQATPTQNCITTYVKKCNHTGLCRIRRETHYCGTDPSCPGFSCCNNYIGTFPTTTCQ